MIAMIRRQPARLLLVWARLREPLRGEMGMFGKLVLQDAVVGISDIDCPSLRTRALHADKDSVERIEKTETEPA